MPSVREQGKLSLLEGLNGFGRRNQQDQYTVRCAGRGRPESVCSGQERAAVMTGGICPQELCSLPGLKGARPEESAGECVVALGMCGPACDGYAGTDLGLSQALDSRPPEGRRQGGMCGEAWKGRLGAVGDWPRAF